MQNAVNANPAVEAVIPQSVFVKLPPSIGAELGMAAVQVPMRDILNVWAHYASDLLPDAAAKARELANEHYDFVEPTAGDDIREFPGVIEKVVLALHAGSETCAPLPELPEAEREAILEELYSLASMEETLGAH